MEEALPDLQRQLEPQHADQPVHTRLPAGGLDEDVVERGLLAVDRLDVVVAQDRLDRSVYSNFRIIENAPSILSADDHLQPAAKQLALVLAEGGLQRMTPACSARCCSPSSRPSRWPNWPTSSTRATARSSSSRSPAWSNVSRCRPAAAITSGCGTTPGRCCTPGRTGRSPPCSTRSRPRGRAQRPTAGPVTGCRRCTTLLVHQREVPALLERWQRRPVPPPR
jgi:hypothetical protein